MEIHIQFTELPIHKRMWSTIYQTIPDVKKLFLWQPFYGLNEENTFDGNLIENPNENPAMNKFPLKSLVFSMFYIQIWVI